MGNMVGNILHLKKLIIEKFQIYTLLKEGIM